MRITSSLRFLYIFDQAGLLCAAGLTGLGTVPVEAAAAGLAVWPHGLTVVELPELNHFWAALLVCKYQQHSKSEFHIFCTHKVEFFRCSNKNKN